MNEIKKVVLFGNTPESLINFRGPLLKSMIEAGNDVYAISPPCTNPQSEFLGNIGVTHIPIAFNRTGINPLSDISTIFSIYKSIKEINPEAIITYALKPIFYGSLVAKFLAIKHYPMLVGLGYTAGYKFSRSFKVLLKGKLLWPIISFFYKFSLNFSENVFVYNKDILNLFTEKRLLNNKRKVIEVNGSGVDIDYFKLAEYPEDISFLLIARLLADKGLNEYVNAARSLKVKYPAIKFKLVGFIDKQNPTAISEETLNQWIDEGAVDYLGKLDDVRPAIADASVYTLPSYHEGIPRSVLEAMSMGRAVITTDTFGCRETVNDGVNGFLVPIKDSNSLAHAMERFILNPSLIPSMGIKSRELAVSKFNVKDINNLILKTMDLI
tara:strand:+ start:8149 stop:9294 length:1146 start_codon:yes stop_codon:yes gene_type:complete